MQSTNIEAPASAQAGLKSTLRSAGFFLACRWFPDKSVEVSSGQEGSSFIDSQVTHTEQLSPGILGVTLEPDTPLAYRAGQFIHLRRPDGLVRSYSLSSHPWEDNQLRLHVRRVSGGRMSQWMHDALKPGDRVSIRGPFGQCYYESGRERQPLLMVGTGTGAGALWGILCEALHTGHQADIFFYHGVHAAEDLYLHDRLLETARAHPMVHYRPCVSGADAMPGVAADRADRCMLRDFQSLAGMRVFLCGLPAMVSSAKKQAYLAGASLDDILADPFEHA